MVHIIFYIIVVLELIWWYTCVDRKEIPLLIEILGTIFALIPGVEIACSVAIPCGCFLAYKTEQLKLKNNWFNRTFLAYRGE